jgi:peptidoglycan/xylan/chitin deacetylase (PgdA/CDA1 family)
MIRSHLRVLAYHRIGGVDDRTSGPSLFSATPADFERQVGYLAERYSVIPLEDVLRAQRGEQSLPRRAVLLTFDDGYRDFGEIVWPILRRYRLPATLFVPTDYPDPCGRAFWWDRVHRAISGTTRPEVRLPLVGTLRLDTEDARRESVRTVQHRIKTVEHVRAMALVDQLCAELNVEQDEGSSVLGWNELRELAKEGLSIAAHTRSHAALTQLDAAAVRSEVTGSLADVKREIGTVLPVFCYPFGLHDDSSVEEVRKLGVELAFTCLEGHNPIPSGDALRLRRTTITRRTSPVVFGLRLRKTVAHFDVWRQRRKQPAMAREGTGREGVRPSPDRGPPVKLGYIMSRFPKLSETFILNEILTLESLGVEIEVYPLIRRWSAGCVVLVSSRSSRCLFYAHTRTSSVTGQVHIFASCSRC